MFTIIKNGIKVREGRPCDRLSPKRQVDCRQEVGHSALGKVGIPIVVVRDLPAIFAIGLPASHVFEGIAREHSDLIDMRVTTQESAGPRVSESPYSLIVLMVNIAIFSQVRNPPVVLRRHVRGVVVVAVAHVEEGTRMATLAVGPRHATACNVESKNLVRAAEPISEHRPSRVHRADAEYRGVSVGIGHDA